MRNSALVGWWWGCGRSLAKLEVPLLNFLPFGPVGHSCNSLATFISSGWWRFNSDVLDFQFSNWQLLSSALSSFQSLLHFRCVDFLCCHFHSLIWSAPECLDSSWFYDSSLFSVMWHFDKFLQVHSNIALSLHWSSRSLRILWSSGFEIFWRSQKDRTHHVHYSTFASVLQFQFTHVFIFQLGLNCAVANFILMSLDSKSWHFSFYVSFWRWRFAIWHFSWDPHYSTNVV